MSATSNWVAADGSCVVEIDRTVLAALVAMADKAYPNETGAALYGRYSDDQRTAYVEGLAPDAPDATRGRSHFQRGVKGLAAFFRRLFRQTAGESYYVGDFHTHPGGAAIPSSQDDESQFAIASDAESQCGAPVLIIVGGVPGSRDFGVFVHTMGRRKLVLTRRAG